MLFLQAEVKQIYSILIASRRLNTSNNIALMYHYSTILFFLLGKPALPEHKWDPDWAPSINLECHVPGKKHNSFLFIVYVICCYVYAFS